MLTGFVTSLFIGTVVALDQDCSWDKDVDFPAIPPFLVTSGTLVLPVLQGRKRIVSLAAGETVDVACPGTTLTILGQTTVQATCVGGQLLNVDGNELEMSSLGCKKKMKTNLVRNIGPCGRGGVGQLQSIGFKTYEDAPFFDLIKVCFENKTETNLYSEHILRGANIMAKDKDSSRPSFKSSGSFFSVRVADAYEQATQLDLMETLLGSKTLASKIIDVPKQFYFAKGHMAPDADFVTEAEQDATYYYINALPQWQAFNNGNWKDLEINVRELGAAHGTDLVVYSGGWGVLTINNVKNQPVEIYLGLAQGKKVIPAPMITWKVVYEPSTNQGVALVGINNPHLTSNPSPICPNICSKLVWLDVPLSELEDGFTYCCTVADLRKAVPHVPDLGRMTLLDH